MQRPRGLGTELYRSMSCVHRGQGLLRIGQEAPPRFGQHHAFREAIEERRTHLSLQRLDLRGHIRLDGVHPYGRAGEVQLLCKYAKRVKLPHFHSSISPTDRFHSNNLLDGCNRQAQTQAMIWLRFHSRQTIQAKSVVIFLVSLACVSCATLRAQSSGTSMVFFADPKAQINEEFWP